MAKPSMEITVAIPLENISSALCSALEGGINYWCEDAGRIEPRAWTYHDTHDKPGDDWAHQLPLQPGGALSLKVIEEGGDENSNLRFRLGAKALKRGLQVMAAKYPGHFGDLLSEDRSDSATGDVLVQCCIFGKIIYG